jgi:hypothetical protein
MKKIFDRFDEIHIGDTIYVTGTSGMCSGGAEYGIGDKVIDVTGTIIKTKDHSFDRKDGWARTAPWCYAILYWTQRPYSQEC